MKHQDSHVRTYYLQPVTDVDNPRKKLSHELVKAIEYSIAGKQHDMFVSPYFDGYFFRVLFDSTPWIVIFSINNKTGKYTQLTNVEYENAFQDAVELEERKELEG